MSQSQQANGALSRIHHPVMLSEGQVENLSDFLNLTIEYVVFFRWIYFKNRPRGNLLIFRSFLSVSFWAFILMQFRFDWEMVLQGVDVDPAVTYLVAVVVGYFAMVNAFSKKSESCGHMYTEMIKAGGAGNTWTAKALSNALALELLTLDLWAHRKYRGLFAKNLFRAIEHAYSKDSRKLDMKLPQDMHKLVAKINAGRLQAKEARTLLDNYQDFLMFRMNQHFAAAEERTTDKLAVASI